MLHLNTDLLLYAYASGLFPMADDRDASTIHWIDPKQRGIMPLQDFHIPKSLAKVIRKRRFEVRANTAFAHVIQACAASRENRQRTWLNDELIELYCDLHALGHAHSVECWIDERLVGGLYGVSLGAAFFGESMFTLERDASKVALVDLVDRLQRGGYQLLDTQFITEHLRRFGAIEISRAAYQRRLKRALQQSASFYGEGGAIVSSTLLPRSAGGAIGSSQSTTQTS